MHKITLNFTATGNLEQDQAAIIDLATHHGIQLYHTLPFEAALELARCACIYYIAADLSTTLLDRLRTDTDTAPSPFHHHRDIMRQLFLAAEIDLTTATRFS